MPVGDDDLPPTEWTPVLTDEPTPTTAPVAPDTSTTSGFRLLTLTGLVLAAAVTLTACTGDADEPADTTSAAGQVTSAEDSNDKPLTEEEPQTVDEATGSSTTGESNGEYVQASEKGPAQNVPEPELPASNSENTDEGVKATVKYWWEAQWYLENAGDGGLVREISAESCTICKEQVEHYEHAYENSVWYHMEPHTIHNISVIPKGDDRVAAAVTMDLSEQISYADDGSAPVVTDAETDQLVRFDLRYLEGRWIVTSIERPERTAPDEQSEDSEP